MHLEPTGDFITWGYKKSADASSYTSMLSLDPKGLFGGVKGINADIDLTVAADRGLFVRHLRTSGYTKTAEMLLCPSTVNSKFGAYLGSESTVGGFSYHNDSVFLHTGAGIFDMYYAAKVAQALYGIGAVKIPTAFNADGSVNYLNITL
jgi:hypothetical protein